MTGLYSLRARYYNPALGRFLSQDTAALLFDNPVELNRYVYTANNPATYSDPSGQQALFEYSWLTVKKVAPAMIIGGAVSGLIIGGVICLLAACGACGETVQGQMAPNGYSSCIGAALIGGLAGAFAGGTIALAAGFGPGSAGGLTAAWGGVGLGFSVNNMLHNKALDWCNVIIAALSIWGGTVGARSVYRFVQRASQPAPPPVEETLPTEENSGGNQGGSQGAGQGTVNNFRFTPRNELLARGQPPFEKMHWLPKELYPVIRQLYGNVLDPFLNFTEPLELGFHKFVHGKWGTVADSYNPYVAQWLAKAPPKAQHRSIFCCSLMLRDCSITLSSMVNS